MVVALAAFSVAAALLVLVPGPDTLMVLRELVRDGRRRGAQTVAGVLCGLAVWVGAAALGLSALLRASHTGYVALKIAGAAYLVWLGIQSLRRRAASVEATDTAEASGAGAPARRARRRLLGRGFVAGLTTNLLNPKVGVFFVTFLPGFVPAGYSVSGLSLLFGAIYVAESALYFGALLLVAGRVTRWLSEARIRRRMNTVTGVVLIGLGVRLAVDQ